MARHMLPIRTVVLLTTFLLVACVSTMAALSAENFTADPRTRGWTLFGDSSLFAWNAASANLNVTWDSSRTNSYFCLPLGTILDRQDDFSLALDLQLTDVAAGVTKPSTFELAV